MGLRPKSVAERNYMRRLLWTMGVYMVLILVTTHLVRREHVTGVLLYVLALVPVLPVLRLLQVLALYIQEEKDEFVRMLVVRSILFATAAVLVVSAFTDFLRSYTPTGAPAPFLVFTVFWVVFGVAQGIQSAMYRVGDDEK